MVFDFSGNSNFNVMKRLLRVKKIYQDYVAGYREYLKLRGFGTHVNDLDFIKRGFIYCWWEPGFHCFWKTWNPGISYFTYKLYLLLGGKEKQTLGTIAVFVLNGLIHNMVVISFLRRCDFPLPFTFLGFGLFSIIFRWLDKHIDLQRIPGVCHFCMNAGLVILSFKFGFYADDHFVSILLSG